MTTCPHCSAPLPSAGTVCPACGAALDATVPLSGMPTTPLAAASAPPSSGAAGDAFRPGDLVAGRYRVVSLLGRGGMGEVFRADDLKLGQPVALKFLPVGLERDPQRLELFLNEVRTARQVTHANVCRVYDIDEVDGRHFLTMEYVDGEDLASLLRRIGRLPQERAVTVARQICAGLAAAHEQGILHRDLKPANVMLDGRGRVKLTDFGLAGLADAIAPGDVRAGTPAYMAPEQASGTDVSVRSDLYSLGLVLYELFTGERAYRAETAAELRRQHETSAPSRPTTLVDGLDPAVERAVLHCLELDPRERPASALAVSAALPGGDPLAAALAAGETPSPELLAATGRRDGLPVPAAVLLALVGFGLFFGLTRWAGTMGLLHHLPLEKRPEVLMDRAQGILEEVGYTEPAYADPVDRAWGLLVWNNVLRQVAAADSSAARWDALRDRHDAAGFWYRQSPTFLQPDPRGVPIFVRGPVTIVNPPPLTAGEATVLVDMAGRLRRLEVQPKRFATEDPAPVDWGPVFALADLDPDRFTETPPRYQRWFAPDRRRAWVGTRADAPDVEVRVEAGSHQGRPVLFNVSTPGSLDELAEDPVPVRPGTGDMVKRSLEPVVILLVIILAIRLIARNRVGGRTDERGALRFAILLFTLFVLANGLRSHALFSPDWASEIWPLIAGGTFMAVTGWMFFNAAEPLGRRVWPTMFVSSSRLLSRRTVSWRDPLSGRSALVAVIAGALIFGWYGVAWRLVDIRQAGGVAEGLGGYNLAALTGQRVALSWVLETMNVIMPVLFVVALVVIRSLVKRTVPTLALTLVVWVLISGVGSLEAVLFNAVAMAMVMVVLLRWGVVAMALAHVVWRLGWLARSADLGAWHGQPAVLALTAVGLLALYGVWAATGDGTPGRDPD